MSYVIAVFKNRNSTLKFYNNLKNAGIGASVMATPKAAGVNCGISVKIPTISLTIAKKLLARTKVSGFLGFFEVRQIGTNLLVSKL